MSAEARATILHADLDAFYASVEQLLDPSLLGTPIAVGGGVVLAASYEAKACGIVAGMPAWRARSLCSGLRFVGGHFRHYKDLGDRVIEVCRDFTPLVERISIDEAFLDVGGSIHLFGPPPEIGAAIRRRVRDEIGLPLSVGVARTKHLAKIASQVAKPDGLVEVAPERELEFLHPLPVELMWGVGPVTRDGLARMGIRTIGDLAAAPPPALRGLVREAAAAKLGSLAANLDRRQIEMGRRAVSVSAQAALGSREAAPPVLRPTLGYLADRVAWRLRAAGRAGRTVTVRVRFGGLRSVSRAVTLPVGVSTTLTISELAAELAAAALADHADERRITLLSVAVSNLVEQPTFQLELPLGLSDDRRRPGRASGLSRFAADRSVDAIRARFGREAVGYAAVVLSGEGRVPEEFRDLAQHQEDW